MSIDKSIKWYIAGPMTGKPQFNYPLFDSAAKRLRSAGLDITSPAEMDLPHVRETALASTNGCAEDFLKLLKAQGYEDETWGDFLSRDVKLIADSLGGIILLPRWETSKGARLEAFVAINLNYPAFEFIDTVEATLTPISAGGVMAKITQAVSLL